MYVDVRMAIMGSPERCVKCRLDAHQLIPLRKDLLEPFSVASEIWGA